MKRRYNIIDVANYLIKVSSEKNKDRTRLNILLYLFYATYRQYTKKIPFRAYPRVGILFPYFKPIERHFNGLSKDKWGNLSYRKYQKLSNDDVLNHILLSLLTWAEGKSNEYLINMINEKKTTYAQFIDFQNNVELDKKMKLPFVSAYIELSPVHGINLYY